MLGGLRDARRHRLFGRQYREVEEERSPKDARRRGNDKAGRLNYCLEVRCFLWGGGRILGVRFFYFWEVLLLGLLTQAMTRCSAWHRERRASISSDRSIPFSVAGLQSLAESGFRAHTISAHGPCCSSWHALSLYGVPDPTGATSLDIFPQQSSKCTATVPLQLQRI